MRTLLYQLKSFSFFSLLSDALEQDSVRIVLVHYDYTYKLVDERKQSKASVEESRKILRSLIGQYFDWKFLLFPCVKPADKKWSTVSKVETLPAVDVMTSHCETTGDKWAENVLHRQTSYERKLCITTCG